MNHPDSIAYLRQRAATLPPSLQKATLRVINDISFQLFPASIDKHHCYVGGLAIHTAEVLEIASQTMNAKGVELDPAVIIPATVYHDFGKIYDYEVFDHSKYKEIFELRMKDIFKSETAGMIFRKTSHRYTIRHPARSYAEWIQQCEKHEIHDVYQEKIAHCILSHHGCIEWQSPVEPQSPEAWVLHISDMLSALWGEMAGKLPWAVV